MSGIQTADEIEGEYLKEMGAELGRFYFLLRNECTILHLDWNEYKALFGESEERIRLLNEAAPAFFFRLQGSLWEAILLHLARLTDPASSGGKSKENLSVDRLVLLVAPEIRPALKSQIAIVRAKCEFSRDWRNRRIAHRDLKLALNPKLKPLASASRLSVGAALEAIAEALNIVESHYCNGAKVAYDWIESPRGVGALLHFLQEGVRATEKRRKRLISGNPLPEDMK